MERITYGAFVELPMAGDVAFCNAFAFASPFTETWRTFRQAEGLAIADVVLGPEDDDAAPDLWELEWVDAEDAEGEDDDDDDDGPYLPELEILLVDAEDAEWDADE
jgi:hypothetical protein